MPDAGRIDLPAQCDESHVPDGVCVSRFLPVAKVVRSWSVESDAQRCGSPACRARTSHGTGPPLSAPDAACASLRVPVEADMAADDCASPLEDGPSRCGLYTDNH